MHLTIQYPVTRNFRSRWFAPLSYLGAFIAIAFLTVLNIALTGYETVTTFQTDFNATDQHWFYRFMPFRVPPPGSTCDPHIFKVGDSFTTNYSFFDWTLDSIAVANTPGSAISYTGSPLTFCDITSVYLTGDLHSWNIDFTVLTTCQLDNVLNLTARTSFAQSQLPGKYSPVLGALGSAILGWDIDGAMQVASMDFGMRVYNAFIHSNNTTPMIYSLQANFNWCPMSLGRDASCYISPPNFTIMYASTVYSNSTFLYYDSTLPPDAVNNAWVLDDDTEDPISNLLQTIHAAIQIDLGNPNPSNFILNNSAINETIIPIFPATPWSADLDSRLSTLYYEWQNPGPSFQQYLPLNLSGPAHIQLLYPCRFQHRKPVGSFIISVLVATLSMFSSGWAIFLLVAVALVKRSDATANRCDGHCAQHQMSMKSGWFDAENAYQLQRTESSKLPRGHEYQAVASES